VLPIDNDIRTHWRAIRNGWLKFEVGCRISRGSCESSVNQWCDLRINKTFQAQRIVDEAGLSACAGVMLLTLLANAPQLVLNSDPPR
jgi:hypothetical protein